MSTPKKPRGDSTLKTLSEERQASIAQHLAEHTLAETRKWLADDGLKTSDRALSEFLSWWQLRSQLQRNESTVETLLEQLKSARPDWTPEQIQQAGQSFFSALALEQQDAKAWFLTQQLNLKRQQLDLDRDKFVTAIKSKLDLAMDEFAKVLKSTPALLEEFNTKFRPKVNAATAK